MESSEYIQSQLANHTNAEGSYTEVKNNRYHYMLLFTEDVGWDWIYGQVSKVSESVEPTVEMWKLRPEREKSYLVEVREVEQRRDIDDDQLGLSSFE